MISLYRFAEVAAYSLLSFMPFLLIALYPFRTMYRFSNTVTKLLVIAVAAVQVILGVWAAFFSGGQPRIISTVSTVIYAVFYFAAVRAPFGKTLFTLLLLTSNQGFVVVAAKCLEGQVFPELSVQLYRWSFSLLLLAVECVTLPPLFIFIKRVFTPAVENESSGAEWRYLWSIPATFYFIWYYGVYGNLYRSALEIALRPANVLFFFFINLGAFVIYSVIVRLVLEQSQNLELRESNHYLAMQALQYTNLQNRISEARQAKHDVRHHIMLIDEYLRKQQYDALRAYLSGYRRLLPDDAHISFCENTAVNAVVLYFAGQAKEGDVDFDARLRIPEAIPVPAAQLSVLFGNLLENAVDACLLEDCEDKRIVLRATADDSSLCLTIDNTFTGTLATDSEGALMSCKHEGAGIGLASARAIAERHRGVLQLEQCGGMFCASVLLNFDESPE